MMIHKCSGCRYRGEHREMGFRPLDVCLRETNLIEATKNYNAGKCPYKKTNGERIRAMSDKELIELFGYHGLCIHIQENDNKWCYKRLRCGNCLAEWLQQPTKEE